MGGLSTKLPVQKTCCKSGFRLRIRRFPLPAKGGKFLSTSVAHGFNKVVIGMTGEVLEGGGLTVFLTHKKQRQSRGEKKQSSSNFQSFEGDELRQSLAQDAISNLIVILGADHELLSGKISRRIAMTVLP